MISRTIPPLIIIALLAACQQQQQAKTDEPAAAMIADPLPSWNDGATKKAIIDYVKLVTTPGTADYIMPEERIATFDNDGTLWAEKPYVQELFAFYQVKKMVEAKPALARQQPFKAVIENDKAYFEKGGEKALVTLLAMTHTGMTEQAFEGSVRDFFGKATFPGKNVPVKQIRYQPQLELLEFLRDNGFKTYICTGGTLEFVRGIAEDFYGIPDEQVIGTSFKSIFADSSRQLYRKPELNHFNDKAGKPVGIQLSIGRPPVFACGNEGGKGDIEMLMYSQTSKYPSFQLLVNHDDAAREFAYSEPDSASLKAAANNKWHVISMKDDWKEVFPATPQ